MSLKPYVCPVCPTEIVETEDGNVPGYYGVLVKDGKPMVGNGAVRPLTCPNDGADLVPAVNTKLNDSCRGFRTSDLSQFYSPLQAACREAQCQ